MSRSRKAQRRKVEIKQFTSETEKKPVNPFDLKYMKKKNVRKQTIGVEYTRFGKVNQVDDRRIGQGQKISDVEKAEKRFMAQRQILGKKTKFNLTEDEDLTHLGQSLSTVAKFEKAIVDDDEGGLDEDAVALANFGGGSLTVKVPDEDGVERKLSRKEIIAELISKSKQAKVIRKLARDEYEANTEKLDGQLKQLISSGLLNKPVKKEEVKVNNSDSYDTLLCEVRMTSGSRAAAGIPYKPGRELAVEQEKVITKLEDEKKARINSKSEDFSYHKSAEKSLKMLEPEFEKDFDPERPRLRKDPSRKGSKSEIRKLARILKREKRGAMKELRLDAKYLAHVQSEEKKRISRQRKEKTNKILHSLQTQESEYKKKKLKKF